MNGKALCSLDLPPREQQVLLMTAEELTTKEIAIEMGVSPKTVEFHRINLMKHVGIHNQIGLTKLAIKWGMITLGLLVLAANKSIT